MRRIKVRRVLVLLVFVTLAGCTSSESLPVTEGPSWRLVGYGNNLPRNDRMDPVAQILTEPASRPTLRSGRTVESELFSDVELGSEVLLVVEDHHFQDHCVYYSAVDVRPPAITLESSPLVEGASCNDIPGADFTVFALTSADLAWTDGLASVPVVLIQGETVDAAVR